MDKRKIHIIQFTPYFPPHIGGLEKVVQDIDTYWSYGEKIIFSGNMGQKKKSEKGHIFFPSYEIISNFPIPKIWSKDFWKSLKSLKSQINNNEEYIVITHTRFFLSSFMGGIFAKKYKLKWIHIEHGSEYVQLSSTFKNKIAYIYDRILGKWILKRSDTVLAISEAAKKFIMNEFGREDVQVWYRGVDFPQIDAQVFLKNKFPQKIIIGYIGRLYKWKNVESLIRAYYSLDLKIKNNIQLVIIGDGEDYERLYLLDKENEIFFTGGVDAARAYGYQSEFDIHIHSSSPGGGLATTLLQAMNLGCMIIATPYEGASEVIENGVNGILLENDSIQELQKGIYLGLEKISKKDIFAQRNAVILNEAFCLEKNIEKLYHIL